MTDRLVLALIKRFTPNQIAAIGITAFLLGFGVVVFGLAPLAFFLLAPAAGLAAASVVSLLISFLGSMAVGYSVAHVAALAYYGRKAYDSLVPLFARVTDRG